MGFCLVGNMLCELPQHGEEQTLPYNNPQHTAATAANQDRLGKKSCVRDIPARIDDRCINSAELSWWEWKSCSAALGCKWKVSLTSLEPLWGAAAPNDGLRVCRGMVALHWNDSGCTATLLPWWITCLKMHDWRPKILDITSRLRLSR